MIEQISAVSSISQGITSAPAATHNNISEVFIDKLTKVDEYLNVAEGKLNQLIAGDEVLTHEVMIAMEQAKLQLSVVVEVRNKLVEAYQELTRMQI
jgi:flagellar hook-basal body complex protein FliE